MKFTVAAGLLLALGSMAASAAEQSPLEKKLAEAMKSDVRTEAEVARDDNRDPVGTLSFLGLEPDMTVVELIPGGGWYTKLLAPVLADKGQLYVAIGTRRLGDLLKKPGFGHVKVTGEDSRFGRSTSQPLLFSLEVPDFDVKKADMVLTFRNYHNFDKAGRDSMNRAAFKALKPGGIYGVVDHTRRHMEPITRENRRRFDPVQAILEIQAAGFELVDYSPIHYRPDDELRYEVGRKTVTGNTDRWTLKFRKP